MEPTILYEDDDVVVVNKPAGLIVHSDGRTKEPTLTEWVIQKYPHTKDVGEPWVSPQGETIPRPGIVHRLDRQTSGALVIAKTPHAYTFLKEQFQNRLVEKEYRAFVYGHPKEDKGIIEAEIVRIRSTPPRWGVKREGEMKKHRAAITEWETLMRGVDAGTHEPFSLMAAWPRTGRTHQIRVHFKHLNHPVVSDPLYAGGKQCALGFERLALHAFRLSLTLPSGERHTFEAPLPADFQEALRRVAEKPEVW